MQSEPDFTGVVFDMDGLMFDTESLTLECWLKAASARGFDLDRALVIETVGRDAKDTCEMLQASYGLGFPFHEIRSERNGIMEDVIAAKGVPVKRGLPALLDWLAAEAIPMAVATSTERSRAESLLDRADVHRYFHSVVCGDEVTRGKPEPDIYLRAAEHLGIEPRGAVALEDSESGVFSAKRAGMRAILIPDIRAPSANGIDAADRVCTSLVEAQVVLRDYLQSARTLGG